MSVIEFIIALFYTIQQHRHLFRVRQLAFPFLWQGAVEVCLIGEKTDIGVGFDLVSENAFLSANFCDHWLQF